MPSSKEEILARVEEHRAAIARLESELGPEDVATAKWPPAGFYLTYYVVAGATIGILASLTSFACHVIGSVLAHQDPLLVLRVYGTFFLGPKALTTDDLNFFMLVAVVHFSVGATAGAVFLVLANRYLSDRMLAQLAAGAFYGLLMWAVNSYFISHLQPLFWGKDYIHDLMPAWVALGTHLVYGLTLGALLPLGRFTPYRPAVR